MLNPYNIPVHKIKEMIHLNKKPLGSKQRALDDISNMLGRYSGTKRGKQIASWLSQYTNFMKQEETFNPRFLKHYKRGEIIMVNFGYRLGNEVGGPHYAIVLDKNNDMGSGTITVLPLSSKKENTKINPYKLDLGDEIYQKLNEKAQIAFSNCIKEAEINPPIVTAGQNFTISIRIDETEMQAVMSEINSMKKGSIALLSQITSISKMRIIKPTRTTDALSGIRLSDESLNAIDNHIKQLYLGK